jgi:hypothetical protein
MPPQRAQRRIPKLNISDAASGIRIMTRDHITHLIAWLQPHQIL